MQTYSSKNKTEELNTPLLLKKKSKKILPKPLTYIRGDTGKTRHYTPAAQEWFNSIYAYNQNYIKSLSIADKNLMVLLKSYFNSQIKNLNEKKTSMLTRLRRLSDKKLFIGKGDIKHTSSRVVITFYVYNIEKMFLIHKLMQFKFGLFYIQRYVDLKKTVMKDIQGKFKITFNRLFTYYEYPYRREHYEKYLSYIIKILNKQISKLKKIKKYNKKLKGLVWAKILTNKEKSYLLKKKILKPKVNYTHNYISFYNYVELAREKYIKSIPFYTKLLVFNKKKFDSLLISKLLNIVKEIYNKQVEFNIVNLKKMHLNSDIYTQAVSSKLRNRDNKLYRVLKKSLLKIKVPVIKKVDEKLQKANREEFFVNRIRNNTINTMFSNKRNIKDRLGHLLLSFFPSMDNLVINVKKRSSKVKRNVSLNNYILNTLKHVNLRGIRVEAKGRLTRRFTASRSVFKMKYKGGLKNVDSSFRGLSTIMLRGIVKSNIQYSVLNSNNRNGAFGVRAWVSSK